MTDPRPITDTDLHAYVDGELDTATQAAVEAHLAAEPEAAAAVAAYRAQKSALHAAYDGVLEEPVPAALSGALQTPRGGSRRILLTRIAASVALLALGGVGGWSLHDYTVSRGVVSSEDFAERAVEAHTVFAAEVRHAVEVPAAQHAHLVGWLSKRVGFPLKTPSLRAVGYELVGGRLLPDDKAAAAQFMYEDKSGRRLTVYVRSGAGAHNTAFRFVSSGGVSAFYWIDGPLAYALVGKIDRAPLHALARLVYDQLTQ